MISSFRVGNFCLYGNVSPQEFYPGCGLDFFKKSLVITKPCCSCLLIECLLWRPRKAMWFPENDFTLVVTTWTGRYLNLHWRMLSHDFCPPVPAQQLPVRPGSPHFQAQRFGLTDSWAVFTSSLFLLLIISFLETMSRYKTKLSTQRSLVSLSI